MSEKIIQIKQDENSFYPKTIPDAIIGLEDYIPALAYNLEAWADQKAIATPDTYTDAVRTTGGDIPIETSAGSKLESIKPVVGSKWTAKMLFNGSYNMLNAAKWGAANSQPYVGGVGSDFVYFLVPELTLGTFGTADENNGLLFTDEDGVNVQPASVYFKPLGATVPQSLTDGTSITPTNVSYDGKNYKDYSTSGAGWLIVPKTIYDNDVCAHIAWEDWYDKHVSLDEPATNPEAVVGALKLEAFLALIQSDKYLRAVNETVNDHIIFGETSATGVKMVGELSVAANAWTNAATGESDSQGNALYRHSTTVSGIKQGGAASLSDGTPMSIVGTTASYVDTNATAGAGVVYYELPTTTTIEKAYTDSVFSGSTIDTATGIMPINDCSIEAQVAMDGEANITVKYAKNIVDQVAINATVDVPQIKREVEGHEERITELEDTAVRTGSYDASVAVGLADNFKGDTIVEAEFYKRKTGGTQSVGSGIAAIKEVRGKSIVWNQLIVSKKNTTENVNGVSFVFDANGKCTVSGTATGGGGRATKLTENYYSIIQNHKYYVTAPYYGRTTIFITEYGSLAYVNEFDIVKSTIWTYTGTSRNRVFFGLNTIDGRTYEGEGYFQLIDLTLMFGAGNEPATAAEFEKMFPLDYYDRNDGTIIPFAGQNLVTTGFNQWDEQWEHSYVSFSDGTKVASDTRVMSKNFIKVFPNTEYYIYSPLNNSALIYAYGENNVYLGAWTAASGWVKNGIDYCDGHVITTPNNCHKLLLSLATVYGNTYKNDICINISDPDRNGTYEPYEKHTLPLDPSQWRDKQGNLVFPYGGMHGVGTAYDYAKVDADGYIRSVVRCFGQVDLGTLTWEIRQVSGTQFFASAFSNAKTTDNGSAICSKYILDHRTPNLMKDKSFNIQYWTTNQAINILDSSYTDAATFKTAMNGVILYYSLTEPVEVELATPVYAKYLVDKDGTEEITPANGTTPYTTMANLSILYAMDARGEIKNLPKNYLSKESAENMLNAMVSAGVIASYTMTWDAANNRYAFVITAPVEPEENNN